jgi:tetratricopeptide (TPR) repeat protein
MTTEQRDLAVREYQAGKTAFERGDYRQAVTYLERSNALIDSGSRLSGEMQIWLVTAYEAAGQRSEALALCRKACQHPDLTTRRQGKRLLYILEAPRLKTRPEWLTEIPDLGAIDENESDRDFGRSKFAPTTPKKRSEKKVPIVPEEVDLSQVNTKDNGFIWVALIAGVAIVGGLIWFS